MSELEANTAATRHLKAAIEQVRSDVAKVEFWADAVAGFAQPVPDYECSTASAWVPSEQATRLKSGDRETAPSEKTEQDDSREPAWK